MTNILRTLFGLLLIVSLLSFVSPAVAATLADASGSGDFYTEAGTRAHFTFVAKLKEKGPNGQLEFRYPFEGLKVKSTDVNYVSFDGAWVSIGGQCLKNAVVGCTFEVLAEADFFRLTVTDASGTAVYQGYLAGGKITVNAP